MSILGDSEIAKLLGSTPPLVSEIDQARHVTKDDPIQASSVDLTIGGIFVPGTQDDQIGGTDNPAKSLLLAQGEMAVVRTHEELALPSNVAGLGFPPSRLSIQGLLFTNPGHVDPGYRGNLHLTVINMARHPIKLNMHTPIITLLFIRLSTAATYDFTTRRAGAASGSPIDQALLSSLSKDFLDVQERSRRQTKEEISKFEKRQNQKFTILGVISSVVIISFTFIIDYFTSWSEEAILFDKRITIIEEKSDTLSKIDTLEDRVKTLEVRVETQ